MDGLIMNPAPGERLLRFVGDRVRFSLRLPPETAKGARALLRTNLGKGDRLRQEVIATHAGKNPFSIAFWRDVRLEPQPNGEWTVEMPLTDVGFYRAKAYMVAADGRQVWPEGPDAGISVHPSDYRTANTIYCAFARMFGESKSARATQDEAWEKRLEELDTRGYTVIPPSGKLRDLIGELPHIFDTLGCRILQLLPVNPAPTTFGALRAVWQSLCVPGPDGHRPGVGGIRSAHQRGRTILRADRCGASPGRAGSSGHGDQPHRLGFDPV